MKIDYLEVKSPFKNLNNVIIDFDEDHLMTVIVGKNGSGKSNVLEALVSLFRNLDLGEDAPFAYEIKYKIGEGAELKWIVIEADPKLGSFTKQHKVRVEQNGKTSDISVNKVKRGKDGKTGYLPNFLFSYYSGPSDRLEKYFKKHRTDYYRKLLKNETDLKGDIRPLFYAKPFHSQFVLLAFFLSNSSKRERKFLKENLGITGLDSVHFVMRKPDWFQKKNNNELFWGARGIVREFLDLLYPHVLCPLKVNRNEDTSLTGKGQKNEFFHLFLPNLDALQAFAKDLEPDVFFKMLESSLLSEIISEVSVRVNKTSSTEPLSFTELSEGEQQLLTVLGLLKFTGGKDSLFLLDEPDTHLNPTWAVKYLRFLKEFVPNHETSHLMMVTHHPLAIAELEKGQLQVMSVDKKNQISAKTPNENPRGMGVNLILRSEMFGMETTLDEFTQNKINLRNFIVASDKLSEKKVVREEGYPPENEKETLERLNEELDKLGFNIDDDDADYSQFLKEKYLK